MLSILDTLSIVVALAVVAAYSYIAYSAVAIRRTMAGGLYRRQALGVGLIGLVFVVIYLDNYLPYDNVLGIITGLVFYAMVLVLLYWVDSSILAARRSDPLDRDTLKWSMIRWIVWVVSVSVIIATITAASYYTIGAGTFNPPDYLNLLFSILFPIPIYIAAFCGVIVIPVAARRSGDITLRKNLQWFFVFLAIQLILQGGLGQVLSNDLTKSNLVDGFALLLGIYPLYQSAKKLIPLYRFPVD
jgi:hypothetical protein